MEGGTFPHHVIPTASHNCTPCSLSTLIQPLDPNDPKHVHGLFFVKRRNAGFCPDPPPLDAAAQFMVMVVVVLQEMTIKIG